MQVIQFKLIHLYGLTLFCQHLWRFLYWVYYLIYCTLYVYLYSTLVILLFCHDLLVVAGYVGKLICLLSVVILLVNTHYKTLQVVSKFWFDKDNLQLDFGESVMNKRTSFGRSIKHTTTLLWWLQICILENYNDILSYLMWFLIYGKSFFKESKISLLTF